MRHPLRFLALLAISFIVACSNVTPAPATETVEALSSHLAAVDGFAFLPPIGSFVDTSGFFGGASLTIKIFELVDGQPQDQLAEPMFTNAGGGHSVTLEDGYYMALWNVAATTSARPDLGDVRVEVWASDLDGSDIEDAEACTAESPCRLGWFDASLQKSKGKKDRTGLLDLSKMRTLPIKVFVQGPSLRPESLGELRTLAEPHDFFDVEDVRNCPANEFTMPGQGLHALRSGLHALRSVGGLFLLGQDEIDGADIRVFLPSEAGELANGILGTDAIDHAFERSAAILIVDDFGGETDRAFALGADLLEPTGTGSDPDEVESYLTSLIEGSGFSHGALVHHQVVQMAHSAGFTTLATPVDMPEFRVYYRDADDPKQYLVIAAVDTNGLDTDVIPERIQNALDGLRYLSEISADDGFDVRDVAVNMSFVIVPCIVLEDFDASGVETFEAYVDALGADNGVALDFSDVLMDLLLAPFGTDPFGADPDPLLQHINQCYFQIGSVESLLLQTTDYYRYTSPVLEGQISWIGLVEWPEEFGESAIPSWDCFDTSVVYVASSGNFSLDYAMYPAAWEFVVGTSSQDGSRPSGFTEHKSLFSNDGSVMAPGALYELSRSSSNQAIAYAGTSFAAPVVSLITALDQMGDFRCWAFLTSALAFDGVGPNVPLADHVDDKCPVVP